MGGYDSTRWGRYTKRNTVEDTLKLDCAALWRQIKPRLNEPGSLLLIQRWFRDGQETSGILVWYHPDRHVFELRYSYAGRSMDEIVPIIDFPCPYGGHRHYFRCPGCSARVQKVYCFGGRFRCRTCHDLTYTSSQESRKPDPMFPRIELLIKAQRILEELESGEVRGKRAVRKYAKLEELNRRIGESWRREIYKP